MSGTRPVVAAFDVDGTLTTGDCVRPFLERLGGRRGLAWAVVRRPAATVAGAARRDRDRLKDVVVGGVFRGRSVAEVETEGHAFARIVETSMLRHDTLARLRWHQEMGHRTVLVSASLRPYLDPLAASLGLDRALCTDVASERGVYLAHLDGRNCRAAEKAVRLRAWLAAEQLGDAQIWAYGDSEGDRALLDMAHRAEWVRGTTVQAVPAEGGR